jgi:hypothetical protein
LTYTAPPPSFYQDSIINFGVVEKIGKSHQTIKKKLYYTPLGNFNQTGKALWYNYNHQIGENGVGCTFFVMLNFHTQKYC